MICKYENYLFKIHNENHDILYSMQFEYEIAFVWKLSIHSGINIDILSVSCHYS